MGIVRAQRRFSGAVSTPVHCVYFVHSVHLRPETPIRSIDARQLFQLQYREAIHKIADQKQIMHPPVTIINVFLCVAFCLRQSEFDPALVVSRSLDFVSRRRKR